MKKLYRHVLFVLSSSVFPYIAAFVYVAFASVEFFFVNQFFTTGTTDLRTFFTAFPKVSILVLPALCASLPYRARESSYPFSSFEAICGQFLALLTVCACMILLTVSVPVAVTFFGSVELSQIISAYLILLLYTACALSACLFFGTLIQHTGAAFLASALLLGATSFSHLVPLYISLPAFLQSFFRAVSFAWHFDAASKGIISFPDIVFFLAVTAAFLLGSTYIIEKRRGNNTPFIKKIAALSVAAFVLLIADSLLLPVKIDTTKNRQFTVSAYSRTVLSELTEPLSISYYRSRTLKDLYPQIGDVEDFLVSYAAESSKVSFELVDPAKDSNAELLNRHGIYGQTIDTSGRESTSYATVYSAVVISYLGKTEVLPFVLDTSSLEYDITSRIQSMVRGTSRTVQVVVGNGLSLSEDYAYVIPWLQSQGFTAVQTCVPSLCSASDIPFTELKSIPLLLLGSSRFTASDASALEDFIASGGKALLLVTPYDVNIGEQGDWSVSAEENQVDLMLMDFGIFFYNTITADISNFRLTLTSNQAADGSPTTERTEYINYPLWPVLFSQNFAPEGLTLFWPCAISLDEESALSQYKSSLESLLVTSPNAWQIKAKDGVFDTNPFAVPQAPDNSGVYSTFTLACHALMQASGGGELYVLGDQYALSVDMLSYASSSASADFRAYDFVTDTLLRLNGQSEILLLKNRNLRNTSLYKMELSERVAVRTKTVALVLGISALWLAAVCILCIILRRKK